MTQYEDSLIAMKRLLDAVGDKHWGQWVTTDIERWRSKGGDRRGTLPITYLPMAEWGRLTTL